MATSRHLFFRALLDALGVPGSLGNAQALVAQAQAEGGAAHWNPLNTTLPLNGSTAYNPGVIPGGVAVQSYRSLVDGVEATRRTLTQANFATLLGALRAGGRADAYWQALTTSPWGTRPPGGLSVAAWLADVERHWYDYALAPVAGS